MSKIPTKEENPNGLHAKYYIQKVKKIELEGEDFFGNPIYKPELEEVEKGSEYFVLRLDDGGGDPKHIEACRKAVLVYAEQIKDHIPQLSEDLIERYG